MSMRWTPVFLLVAMAFIGAACQGSDSGVSTDATRLDAGPVGADANVDATSTTVSITATTTGGSGTDTTATTTGSSGTDTTATTTQMTTASGQGAGVAGPTRTIGAVPVSDEGLEGAELEEYLASRYEAFWFAFDQARRNPSSNPGAANPDLANLASGEQLRTATAELADMASAGQALRDPEQPALPGLDHDSSIRIRVDRVDGAVAELTACLVNDQVHYQVADDAALSSDVVTVQATATMARTDGTWKLIRSQAVALDAGIGGCWLEDEANFPR